MHHVRRDEAQQACSKRSCEKKKTTLREAKLELLQAMKELGCDHKGPFIGRPDHTGQNQEYVLPFEPAGSAMLHLNCSSTYSFFAETPTHAWRAWIACTGGGL